MIRKNSENAFYHLIQYLSSSRVLSAHVNVKTHRIIILSTVLCGRVTTAGDDHGLTAFFVNGLLTTIIRPKEVEVPTSRTKDIARRVM